MKAYINSIGAIAPQETLSENHFLDQVEAVVTNRLEIIKPDYRAYIDPKVLRRMSKVVRMAIVAAKVSLEKANLKQPDAIITGTGMGCQVDTEKFLNVMLENNETMLNPTAFIQSTHNTMGAQIALMLGNKNYNLTFVHRTFSFESALLDALMKISEKEASNILVGGIDEITEESWLIKTRIGYYKSNPINNLELLKDKQTGALAGESAAFFVLSGQKTPNTYAQVSDVQTFFKPASIQETNSKIQNFLQNNGIEANKPDLVIMGYNGDQEFDQIYQEIENKLFHDSPVACYKHLCGEHDTSSAFATWLGSRILKEEKVPEILMKNQVVADHPKNVLIYNQFRNINHSLILLKKP